VGFSGERSIGCIGEGIWGFLYGAGCGCCANGVMEWFRRDRAVLPYIPEEELVP
jgi:hypothetical protein